MAEGVQAGAALSDGPEKVVDERATLLSAVFDMRILIK